VSQRKNQKPKPVVARTRNADLEYWIKHGEPEADAFLALVQKQKKDTEETKAVLSDFEAQYKQLIETYQAVEWASKSAAIQLSRSMTGVLFNECSKCGEKWATFPDRADRIPMDYQKAIEAFGDCAVLVTEKHSQQCGLCRGLQTLTQKRLMKK